LVELDEPPVGAGADGAADEPVLAALPAGPTEAADGVAVHLHVEAREVAGEEGDVARREGEGERGGVGPRLRGRFGAGVELPVRGHVAADEAEGEGAAERGGAEEHPARGGREGHGGREGRGEGRRV